MRFGDYEMTARDHLMLGMINESYILEFPNGYSVSVIRGVVSRGAWELAVLDRSGVVYDTPVTDEVERGDEARIVELIAQVEALPAKEISHGM